MSRRAPPTAENLKHGGMWASWVFLLVVAWLAYLPGLSGSFLFDDFVNLPSLGETGAINNSGAFWRFVTSGTADPTGRPLALLTFLLDARDWPADAAPFLRTNVMLHLLNGTLLFIVLRELGKAISSDSTREDFAALLGAALWLLHPLFVSTTLYVVQREAMLPATFALLGLWAYVRGRLNFERTAGKSGMSLMMAAVVGGTGLAFLSKANGVLFPVLLLVIEWCLLGRLLPFTNFRIEWFRRLFLGVPTLAVLAFLSSYAVRWNQPARGWSIGQRALTEARVLFDYLYLLAVPRSVSTGLYNENYLVSEGILSPPSTLICVLGILLLAGLALAIRKRAAAFSAAIAFFLAGHALESSVIPLEIYFEHRNYLPALLLFWPLARVVSALNVGWSRRIALATLIVLLFSATTYQRSEIWGQPEKLAALWSMRNPHSSRAQVTTATQEVRAGRPDLAARRLDRLWRDRPDDLQIALNYVNARCAIGSLQSSDAQRLQASLAQAEIASLLVRQWLETAIGVAAAGQCTGLDLATVRIWVETAASNPSIATPLASEKSIPPLFAMLALAERRPNVALKQFNRALAANITPETAAGQAALLGAEGYPRHAIAHLNYYDQIKHRASPPPRGMPTVHAWVLARQGYWPRELAILRARLVEDLAKSESK
jgi:protein O-mannosyl-transferase